MGRRLVAKKMIKFYILHLSRARRFACECNERGARSVTVHRWPCHLVCALITSEHASWESSSEIRCRVRRIGYDHVVIWSAYSLYFSETRNDRSSPPRKHSGLFAHFLSSSSSTNHLLFSSSSAADVKGFTQICTPIHTHTHTHSQEHSLWRFYI